MIRFIIITVVVLFSFQSPLCAQDERLIPSYDERSEYIYDHPEVDINVYPFVNTWKNSKITIDHGGFAEQAVFTRGNPVNPPEKGATLKYIRAYNHGFLFGNERTKPTKHDNEQVIFYVMKGIGRVEAGGKKVGIKEGTGVFIPAGLEYCFGNTSGIPLEVIIIVEGLPSGFEPRKNMVVKSYYDATPGYCCWAYTTYSLFGKTDGLAEPMGISVVT
ncbi:cupin domain-containing protein, partial [Candidatus Latescibacterota bacterium]